MRYYPMNKRYTLAIMAFLMISTIASTASAMYYSNTNPNAMHYNSPYYYNNNPWYKNGWNMWSQYPGGTFWSPQPVASTPLYSYYNTDYYGYNYGSNYNYGHNNYGYNTGYNTANNCPIQYYDGSRYGQTSYYYDCRGRISTPQTSQPVSYSYYRNDPYNTGYNPNYPNYLTYGWEY